MGQIYGIKRNSDQKIVYIGQTTKNYLERWNEHIRTAKRGQGFAIHAALRKYNYDFSPVLIEECEQLNDREKYWINFFNTKIGCGGYNMTDGGEQCSDNIKTPVYQYTIDGIYVNSFSSISEAAREISGFHNGICKVLNGKLNIAYGYRWSNKKQDRLPPLNTNYTGSSKPVMQLDLQNNIINIFSSTKEAARFLNKSQGNISMVANGKRNSAYGYKWKFID